MSKFLQVTILQMGTAPLRKTLKLLVVFLWISLLSISVSAQESGPSPNLTAGGQMRRIYNTRPAAEVIKLDGIADESAWDQVEWASGFTEQQPDNGTSPTQE